MNMTNPVFQEASVCPKKYGREALLPECRPALTRDHSR